jgi:hypothetical protein
MNDRIDLQRRVAGFVEEYSLEAPIQARVLDLISEIGESSKEILKATGYGREAFQKPKGWDDEFGNAFFSRMSRQQHRRKSGDSPGRSVGEVPGPVLGTGRYRIGVMR